MYLKDNEKSALPFFISGLMLLLIVTTVGTINWITYDRNVGGYLKRAADANTVAMAYTELTTAITYLEQHKLTDGYTSILYQTPDEDIGFWYRNLKASQSELQKVGINASQLESSNILIKLRETLLDSGKITSVTAPDGISRYPNNTIYPIFHISYTILIIIGLFKLHRS